MIKNAQNKSIVSKYETDNLEVKMNVKLEKKNAFKFVQWDVDNGPDLVSKTEVWEECTEKANTDLNGAAHCLRRGMEDFFEETCDALCAEIKYNSQRKWDFGQYSAAAYKSLSKRFEDALKHAKKYDNQEGLQLITDLRAELQYAYSEVQKNNWITNCLVHNNTEKFSSKEFIVAVDTMKKFASCFVCAKCNAKLYVSREINPTILRCKCGNINFPID